MGKHVVDYLLDAAAEASNQVAIEFAGRHFTYGEVGKAAATLAASLPEHGITPGASVGMMLPNLPQFVQALYGAWMNENVVVPMNVLLTPPEVRYLVEDSELSALFVYDAFLPQVEAALLGMESPPRLFVVGKPGAHVPFSALLEAKPRAGARRPKGARHILTIYTSGTTGKPKGAVITNDNVDAQLAMTDMLFDQDAEDKTLCVLPLFHVFALNGLLNFSIRHRGTLVLHPKFDLDALIKSLSHDGISVFAGVPTMYFYLMNHPEVANFEFPRLRYCVTGGAAMPVDVMRAFEERFQVPIYEGYGLTETTVSVCCNRADAKKIGSVGKAYPGVLLRIVDEAGHEVPTGERGEIVVKGPNIMDRYLNRPEATREAIVDGWLQTGDVGYVDDEGFVFIVDRKKDMIIKGGYNIYPREIEEVLYQMPEVAEAAVVGVEDEAKGERVRAVISVRPGAVLDQGQVEEHLRENLAKYKLPSEYVFMEELPKGPTGKILKRELRA